MGVEELAQDATGVFCVNQFIQVKQILNSEQAGVAYDIEEHRDRDGPGPMTDFAKVEPSPPCEEDRDEPGGSPEEVEAEQGEFYPQQAERVGLGAERRIGEIVRILARMEIEIRDRKKGGEQGVQSNPPPAASESRLLDVGLFFRVGNALSGHMSDSEIRLSCDSRFEADFDVKR